MEQADFLQVCDQYRLGNDYSLSAKILPAVRNFIDQPNKRKLPVIWLETSDSGDNNIAFMNTTYPYLHQVFTDMIDLLYSNTFMAAQGTDALDLLFESAKEFQGEFVLVVEGAIRPKTMAYIMLSHELKREILPRWMLLPTLVEGHGM